jgi:hypothetical protein
MEWNGMVVCLVGLGLAHHSDYGADKSGGEQKSKKKTEKFKRMIMEAEVLRSRNKISDALAMFEQILIQVTYSFHSTCRRSSYR